MFMHTLGVAQATARAMAKEMTRIRAAKARFMKMGGTMKAMEHKTTVSDVCVSVHCLRRHEHGLTLAW